MTIKVNKWQTEAFEDGKWRPYLAISLLVWHLLATLDAVTGGWLDVMSVSGKRWYLMVIGGKIVINCMYSTLYPYHYP